MAKARLGVALLLPPPVAAEVDGLRRALGDGSLRRIPAHLTLVPPVNVAEGRLGRALAVLRDAAAATRPITLCLGPPATFLPDNPVLYLRADGEVAEVQCLRDRVRRDPLARTTTWPFVPHVTLADSAPPEVIEAAITALGRYQVEVRFEHVHLLREGPDRVWEPMAQAAFRAPAVIGRGGLPLELTVADHLDGEAASSVLRPFAVTARREGQAVGTATGIIQGERAVVDRLLVDPAHRRQGVGSHLLAAVQSHASEAGCTSIVVNGPLDQGAEAFLRARGWSDDSSRRLRRSLAPDSGD